MKFNFFRDCLPHRSPAPMSPATVPANSFNYHEEYAAAFRTESYTDFWAHVLDVTLSHGAALRSGNSAAMRLPSYRLFAMTLLNPDEPTASAALPYSLPTVTPLLADYFKKTADASIICSLLLKNIEQIRRRYRPTTANFRSVNHRFTKSSAGLLASLASSKQQVVLVQEESANLLKRLGTSRTKIKAKLRFISRIKQIIIGVVIVAVTATVSVIGACLACHALIALMLPLPCCFPSARRLDQELSLVDAAARGTYTLTRDLDTINGLVQRLQNEIDHMVGLVWVCRKGDGRKMVAEEVFRQMVRNDHEEFVKLLDDLEEHLYLCFLTINKARNRVLNEILSTKKHA